MLSQFTFVKHDQWLGFARDQSVAEVGGVIVAWYLSVLIWNFLSILKK